MNVSDQHTANEGRYKTEKMAGTIALIEISKLISVQGPKQNAQGRIQHCMQGRLELIAEVTIKV